MARNYLKGFAGDQINALMAATAFNLRRWLRKVKLLPDFWADWIINRLMRIGSFNFITTKNCK